MSNRICEILGIEKPVIQGPMVWLTDARLAAAVSNAGGMGSLGPNAGQTVVTRDPEGTAENMRAEIRKVRELTDKPFSVNVLPTQGREDIYTPPMLKVIYEELGRKMGGFANLRLGMLEGDMDNGYVSVGNGISHIHEIKSCQAIIDELTAHYAC